MSAAIQAIEEWEVEHWGFGGDGSPFDAPWEQGEDDEEEEVGDGE